MKARDVEDGTASIGHLVPIVNLLRNLTWACFPPPHSKVPLDLGCGYLFMEEQEAVRSPVGQVVVVPLTEWAVLTRSLVLQGRDSAGRGGLRPLTAAGWAPPLVR